MRRRVGVEGGVGWRVGWGGVGWGRARTGLHQVFKNGLGSKVQPLRRAKHSHPCAHDTFDRTAHAVLLGKLGNVRHHATRLQGRECKRPLHNFEVARGSCAPDACASFR